MRDAGATGASESSARRRREICALVIFADSSKRLNVMKRRAIPAIETRNVRSISGGRPPSAVANTRGWTSDSARRTAMKLSGTNAPAVIANTDA